MVKDLLSKTEKDVWDRDDYYIASFRGFPDGSIILQKCNNTYLSFNGLTPGDVGKRLKDIFPETYFCAVRDAFKRIRSVQDCLTHIRELNCSYWETNIYFEGTDLKILSKRITDVSATKFSDRYLNHIDFNIQRERVNYSLILRRDNSEGRYLIEQHSGNLCETLGVGLENPPDVADLMKARCTWFKTTAVLDDCIRLNKPMRILEIFHKDGSSLHLVLTLLPLISGCEDRVILTGFQINEDEYYRMQQQPANMYDDLMQSKYIGTCLVVLQNTPLERCPYMLQANPYFEGLLANGSFTLEDICQDHIITNCLKKRAISTGSINLPSENGVKRFLLCAVPTEYSGRFLLSLCPRENLFTGTSILSSTLTQREHEVINYVVDGRTNRQIACALDISEGTVKKIIYNAYQKLHITSRIDLIKLVFNY